MYVFIGTFIGGGVVLNGSLFTGKTGNAGAIGSLPQPVLDPQGKLSSQLHERHSSSDFIHKTQDKLETLS